MTCKYLQPKAPTKSPAGTHPEEQARGAPPRTKTSAGGCWSVVLSQKAPAGPGAEDTPQLPSDQMVLQASRASSHVFPWDGQFCCRQLCQTLPCTARDPHITDHLCSRCSALPPQALHTFSPFFPMFWHCHYVNILTTSSFSLPGRDEDEGGDTSDTTLSESAALRSKPGFFLQKSLLQNPWKRGNVRPPHATIKALVYWRQNTFCITNFGRGQMTLLSVPLQILCS